MFRSRDPFQPPPVEPSGRTYVVLAVGDDAAPAGVRALGTVTAACRGAAQALARAIHATVPAARLRVVAAGSAPAGLLVRALACDGEEIVRAGA